MNVTAILVAALVVGGVGILIGFFLGISGEKFKVEVDEKEVAILGELPGNNCGGCGYAGCSGLAAAIAKGEAPVNQCPVGGAPVAAKIGAIMGVDAGAIEAVYPKTEIQQCIIHQIRNSTKFVSYKDIKKLMADLKLVYAAPTEETALNELELFKDKWDSKYPKIYKSWHDNWATLSTYFKYPEAVRRLIYTTNAIEGFNRQLRKVTKSKTVFPSDDSLLKMLYLATMDITKKWTGHRQDWGQIHSQLEIYFEERLIGRNL